MKQELLKAAKVVAGRLVDTDSLANVTNASTVGGVSLIGLASQLMLLPEPNSQIAGGVLLIIGLCVSFYKQKKA